MAGRLRTVRNYIIILCIGALRARVGFNCPDEPPWGLSPTPCPRATALFQLRPGCAVDVLVPGCASWEDLGATL